MMVKTSEEMCRVLQFIDHFIQQCNVADVLPQFAEPGNCFGENIAHC